MAGIENQESDGKQELMVHKIRITGEAIANTHACIGENCLTCFMNYRGWVYFPAERPHWTFTKPSYQAPSYVMTMNQSQEWFRDSKNDS